MTHHREWQLDRSTHVIAAGVALLALGAGIIHISAAADHANLPVMMVGFVVVAILQIGLAGLLLLRRPSRPLLMGGLVLMLGSVLVWLVSRTVGLPFLPGGHMEPIGFKDGVTVLLELAAVPGLFALRSPLVQDVSLPSPQLGRQALTGLATGVLLLFLPALLLGGGGHHSAAQMAAMGGHGHGGEHHSAAAPGHHGGAGHHGEHTTGSGQVLGGHGHGASGHTMSAPHHGSSPSAMGHSARHGAGHGSSGHHAASMMSGSHGGGHAAGGHHGMPSASGHSESGHMGGHSSGGHGGHSGGGHHSGGGGHAGHSGGGGHHSGGGDHGGHSGGGHGGHGGGHGGHGEDRGPAPVPGIATQRAQYIEPKPAGTRETVTLQYGPHPVPPGGDANQVNFDFYGAEGFITSVKPVIRYADGSEVGHSDGVHLHHAHLFRKDTAGDDEADTRQGMDWVFGTGGEQTQGSFERISNADPGSRDAQWGVRLHREPMLMVWMPMNMTEQSQTVFMEFEFTFVHGTPAQIKERTGTTYRAVEPVMYGSTFNVPKTGGVYDWPLDASRSRANPLRESKLDPNSFGTAEPTEKVTVEPGVGEIWTAPHDGVIIGSAGHMHGGGRGVVVSNLGSEQRPCAEDGDRYPGTTVFNSRTYYPQGIFPAHPLMGLTQPGWRVHVEKGDRIAINGVYDARKYAYPDQMSILGFYWDKRMPVSADQRCGAHLVDEPGASQDEVIASLPSQTAERGDDGSAWVHAQPQPCVAEECNNPQAPPKKRGPDTNVVAIKDFTFTPGDLKSRTSVPGAPVVQAGDPLRFVNLDYGRMGGTRHAIASCYGPCNGPTDVMSYPNSNGLFYSGPLGYLALSEGASANNKAAPTWDLDTSKLEPGYHTYFCWSHPWMRGAFYVAKQGTDPAAPTRGSMTLPRPSPTPLATALIPDMLRPSPAEPDVAPDPTDGPRTPDRTRTPDRLEDEPRATHPGIQPPAAGPTHAP